MDRQRKESTMAKAKGPKADTESRELTDDEVQSLNLPALKRLPGGEADMKCDRYCGTYDGNTCQEYCGGGYSK
jgi:hypothetical protein